MDLDAIPQLFETLMAEGNPRHLPPSGTVYKFVWEEDRCRDDWKADGYRWRNQGAGKKIQKFADVGITKTFFHVSIELVIIMLSEP